MASDASYRWRNIQTETFHQLLVSDGTLEAVDMGWNEIGRLELGRLPPGLLSLRLPHNRIRWVRGAGGVRALRYLDLSHNRLERVEEGALASVADLEHLLLVDNQLPSLPRDIGCLRSLHSLILGNQFGGNRLRSLPPGLGQLSGLRVLALSHNQLEEIPPCLDSLAGLSELYLDHNRIGRVEGAPWPRLVRLDLSYNRIAHMAVSKGQLGTVKVLDLSFNQLEFLDRSLIGLSCRLFLTMNPCTTGPRLRDDPSRYCQLARRVTERRPGPPSCSELVAQAMLNWGSGPPPPRHLKLPPIEDLSLCARCPLRLIRPAIESVDLVGLGGHPDVPYCAGFCSPVCHQASAINRVVGRGGYIQLDPGDLGDLAS